MTRNEFEELVKEALDSLPEEFAKKLDNVEVVVGEWPTREQLLAGRVKPGMTLFGLYQGIPQTQRSQYFEVLPDKITIFAGPILMLLGNNLEAVKDQVRKTVMHEIGHHFGMSDAQIHQAQEKNSK